MVQEFYVLKCNSCELYQVHIVKKAKKWACKVCGTKQSVIKVYGQGSAKDCRLHVQKLNDHSRNINAGLELFVNECTDSQMTGENKECDFDDVPLEMNVEERYKENVYLQATEKPRSKWQKYVEPEAQEMDLPISDQLQSYDSDSPNEFYETYNEPNSKRLCTAASKISGENTTVNLQPYDDKVLKFFDANEFDVDEVLDF